MIRWCLSVIVCLGLFGSFWSVALATPQLREEIRQAERVPVKKGERCIICGATLDEDDVVLIVRGRRIPLVKGLEDDFLQNAEKYFQELQPKGALFSESLGTSEENWTWFTIGVLGLLLILHGTLCSVLAMTRGLSPGKWFLHGLLGNLAASFLIIKKAKCLESLPEGLARIPSTSTPVLCDACGHSVHPSATKCNACGAALTPSYESEMHHLS